MSIIIGAVVVAIAIVLSVFALIAKVPEPEQDTHDEHEDI